MTSFTRFDPKAFLKNEDQTGQAAKPAKVEITPEPTLAGLAGLAGGQARHSIFIPDPDSAREDAPGSCENSSAADVKADLAWLSPAAQTAITTEPDGTTEAYIRQPNGQWSTPLPVLPPSFERPGSFSLPVCSGWCSGCGEPSIWRRDKPQGEIQLRRVFVTSLFSSVFARRAKSRM